MDLARAELPAFLVMAAWVAAVVILAIAAWRVDWREASGGPLSGVLPAAIFGIVLLWSIRASIGPQVDLHLGGIAVLALAAGSALALVGGAVVVAIATVLAGAPVANAAVVWVTLVAIPVTVVMATRCVVARMLPANFFVYVFLVAFLGGALAYAAGSLAAAAIVVSLPGLASSFEDLALAIATLAFGEATLTGMLVTLGVVYRPHWIATWRDPS
jgi:uncharacterized membrane protein